MSTNAGSSGSSYSPPAARSSDRRHRASAWRRSNGESELSLKSSVRRRKAYSAHIASRLRSATAEMSSRSWSGCVARFADNARSWPPRRLSCRVPPCRVPARVARQASPQRLTTSASARRWAAGARHRSPARRIASRMANPPPMNSATSKRSSARQHLDQRQASKQIGFRPDRLRHAAPAGKRR